jgi:hypothetical protein
MKIFKLIQKQSFTYFDCLFPIGPSTRYMQVQSEWMTAVPLSLAVL